MADGVTFATALSCPMDFKINPVRNPGLLAPEAAVAAPVAPPVADLGPLAAFSGNFRGLGFNTIFRPDNPMTPTPFTPPIASDNVLELNLTQETLSFSNSLGNVPNRGSGTQGDIFLNGVPYLQTVNDVTTLPPTGIHFEPGLWLAVPATAAPNEPVTVTRMASIPHGTTINAEGTLFTTVPGGPVLNPVGITPFVGGQPTNKVSFPSQTATNQGTPRIPPDLSSYIAAGTITQAMLDDPVTVLRNAVANQTITQTAVIFISTNPGSPLPDGPLPPSMTPSFGGGTANIAFLDGVPNPPASAVGPNAESRQMDAIFWIETVTYCVDVPPLHAGSAPVVLAPVQTNPPVPVQPSFVASIPFKPGKSFPGGRVTVETTQIQYVQKVILNFNGLSWPHVSVATLVPADPVPIPESLLPLV
jgi:prepilin-type processing-associated H-X9-DG protein